MKRNNSLLFILFFSLVLIGVQPADAAKTLGVMDSSNFSEFYLYNSDSDVTTFNADKVVVPQNPSTRSVYEVTFKYRWGSGSDPDLEVIPCLDAHTTTGNLPLTIYENDSGDIKYYPITKDSTWRTVTMTIPNKGYQNLVFKTSGRTKVYIQILEFKYYDYTSNILGVNFSATPEKQSMHH